MCHMTICAFKDTINHKYKFFTPQQWLEKWK